MTRTEFPPAVRRAAWTRCGGFCEGEDCGAKLWTPKFEYDHVLACALGGDNSLENCAVLCLPCHKAKTGQHDIKRTSKANRQRSAEIKAKRRKSRPMPGTRASGIRKRMDGTVERW